MCPASLASACANLGALLMATVNAYDAEGGPRPGRCHHLPDDGHGPTLPLRRAGRRRRHLRRLATRAIRRRPQPRHDAAHPDANGTGVRMDDLDTPVWAAATEAWQDVLRLGEEERFP
ncbi:hypothetical protein GCM10017687_89520 [Streptomyces echinatus]